VSAENASERPTGNRSEPDSCGPDCAVPSLIQRLQAAEEERDRYKAAMELMLSPETDWDDGAVGVGYGFRNIARLALTTPTKSEEKR
jgi:hypothetical protein